MITFGSLFAGIGGFDLGLERAGMVCKWQVEKDEFCQKVLTKHWPDVPRFGDIKNVTKKELEPVDLICGGFPCQPFSNAGNKRGKADDRYLWPEMLRVIRELSPRWVIGENVAGFINMELENAFTDLETEGYKVEAFVLPANAVELRHRRDRIWIMAYTCKVQCFDVGDKLFRGNNEKETKQRRLYESEGVYRESPILSRENTNGRMELGRGFTKPPILRVSNGLSTRLDKSRIAALGNAVVPQIPEILGRAIMEIENEI